MFMVAEAEIPPSSRELSLEVEAASLKQSLPMRLMRGIGTVMARRSLWFELFVMRLLLLLLLRMLAALGEGERSWSNFGWRLTATMMNCRE